MSVCVHDRVACVRLVGRANFASSVDFKKLLRHLQDDGCTEIVLDLSRCAMMDSTFLGVLAHIGGKFDAERQQGRRCRVELFHPSDRVIEMLENLGVLKLFTIIDAAPEFGAFQRVEEGNASRVELNRTCYEAHQALMNTSPENERRFKDATEFFRRNLKDDEGKE